MISYCGLTCSKCEAYLATKTNDLQLAQKTAESWAKQFNATITVDDVWCDGCLVDGKKCSHCGECEIRACARPRGIANCAHCPDYACETLSNFFQMVPFARTTLDDIRAALG